MACLAVGVAAVVAVAGLSSSLDQGIRLEARKLLAADVAIEGRRPISAPLEAVLAATPGIERTQTKEMPTIVAALPSGAATPSPAPSPAPVPGHSLLVELKAAGAGYPFYGIPTLDPARPLIELLDPEGAIVAPDLLTRLGLSVGDRLKIGAAQFTIRGVVLSEPDKLTVSFSLGPRVFLSLEGLDRAGLERFGSHIEYRTLVKLPDGSAGAEADALASRLRAALAGDASLEVETFAEAQPALRDGLRRAGRFLGLVALVSLLIGGIGVAQAVRAWLASRMDTIAVLKCLGMRPREVISLYLGQTLLLGIGGSLVGALAGTVVMVLVKRLLADVLPNVAIQPFQPFAVLRGIGLGIGVALLFSVPPLAAIRRMPPVRVMRREVEPLPPSRWARAAAGAILIGGIFGTAWLQSSDLKMGAGFTGGILAATGVLSLAAFAVTRSMGRIPSRFTKVWLRHGLSAVARPGAGTLGAIVALGLGVLVVLGQFLVHGRLMEQMRADLPENAPTAFLVDIQPDEWPGVKSVLESGGASRIDSVPVVDARLDKVNGRPVDELASEAPSEGRRRWVLTREQNLTYLDKLPAGNQIVEGALWKDPTRPEISLERDFAKDLGVGVGSTLDFNVQGVPLQLAVTSLRTVDWKTFGINFFLIVEPGVLEQAPQSRVAAARLPAGEEQEIQDRIAARYPNVTLLRIREITEKVTAILDRLGLGIRILGSFTVAAGIAILAGAVSASSARRGREVALLKTLGMTRRGVAAVFTVEYALVGLVAGTIGSVGGAILAWAVLTRGMEIPWEPRPAAMAGALAGSVFLSVVAGLAASLRALSRRPIEVLRAE